MQKFIFSIYGLGKEAAAGIIKQVEAVDPAILIIMKYYYDEPCKTVFIEVVRQNDEEDRHFKGRFRRATGIDFFTVHKHYPLWRTDPKALEVAKPQPKRCGFLKILFGRFFGSAAV